MSNESKELRDLAYQIAELARNHSCYSMIYPAVQHLCDYLQARARILELEEQVRGTS